MLGHLADGGRESSSMQGIVEGAVFVGWLYAQLGDQLGGGEELLTPRLQALLKPYASHSGSKLHLQTLSSTPRL